VDAAAVYIVENEITYLAFPEVPEATVMWGSGFAISGFASLSPSHTPSRYLWIGRRC
jgi:hypothetical protein